MKPLPAYFQIGKDEHIYTTESQFDPCITHSPIDFKNTENIHNLFIFYLKLCSFQEIRKEKEPRGSINIIRTHYLIYNIQDFIKQWALACKANNPLGSIYSHKSKKQVLHQQNFKDLLSSKCPVRVERSMFSHIETSGANICIIANGVCL